MRRLLCHVGWHRWVFADVREEDVVWTWGWCKNIHCPRYSHPLRINAERKPVMEEHGDRA